MSRDLIFFFIFGTVIPRRTRTAKKACIVECHLYVVTALTGNIDKGGNHVHQ